jgi:hypothetical protein
MNKAILFSFLAAFLWLGEAFAQCESPGSPPAAAGSVTAAQASDVTSMTESLKSSYSEDIDTATESLMDSLAKMEQSIMDTLNALWTNWEKALRDMTEQLHAGTVDATRQFTTNQDASDMTQTALDLQQKELEAKQRYQPTGQACRFDTTAKYLGYGKQVTGAVATGYALDFNKVGANAKGSPASEGEAGMKRERWRVYQSKFCDGDANNGAAGCAAGTNNPKANMHVLPSKTIFARETIDLSDADIRDAVTQLMFNITGYRAPDLIPVGALKSAIGLEQRQKNREYMAQMDAVGALAYSVVAERAPGKEAPEIQAARVARGVLTASPKPSEREIRESIVEELWDPVYFVQLSDSPATIPQKELYLKAYSLFMLYNMLEKQEKISNVYAIETANMLNEADHSRHGATSSAPLMGAP